ncbi:hypothetical protein FRC02_007296 [Tulasnella sp. 418]|nr:hypothetical protein FRC02_007296 [Tulasnella sp. 418]
MSDVSPQISRPGSAQLQPSNNYDPLTNNTNPATNGSNDQEDSDDEFIYPGAEPASSSPASSEFRYEPMNSVQSNEAAVGISPPAQPAPVVTPPQRLGPSTVHLESIAAAASAGDLERLQTLFQSIIAETGVQSFVLANEAAQRTGLTVLHHAASRGHLSVVEWLVQNCGALTDLEDKEGETALHKASLNGHLGVVKYLLSSEIQAADVHTTDADGWTALHNACSKGYLDIVRWLCEQGGAADVAPEDAQTGVRGVDKKSKGGWTPLMNASSKGHLPVVLYLLTKQNADPLVRNNWGETAYDAAAAVFEVWICEVLQRAEAERWQGSTAKYDPLAVHTTVPLILYENQRLDTRLKTLAVNGGRPKFSASGLGRRGRKPPFELKVPPNQDIQGSTSGVAAWRSDIQLPFIEAPFILPKPQNAKENPSREGAERSHFWLSDWTLDLTHPKVDADEGWQYSRSLDDSDDRWAAEVPPQLERLLTGSGVVSGLASPTAGSSSSHSNGSTPSSTSWARRRRWVRVMRRRLDIPPLPFLQPDGQTYHLAEDGSLIPVAASPTRAANDDDDDDDGEGQELGAMPTSFLSSTKDYVARARYLADSPGTSSTTPGRSAAATPADIKRAINKLERAVNELRTGMLGDDDQDRKRQAEVLLNTYNRELERARLSAGADRILNTTQPLTEEEDEYDSDESFHYPLRSPAASVRAPSVRSQQVTDYFSRASTSTRVPSDLTPQLSQAPEFRVPTHEAPQKVRAPRWTPPTPHQMHAQWERDENVSDCRSCKRRFTFYFRKHCRRCGKIFCDRCSSFRALLDPADVVHDPVYPDTHHSTTSAHRVCETCYDVVTAAVPSPLRMSRSNTMEGIVVSENRLAVPGHSREVSSQISDLADCPVCGQNLADLGPAALQENHVKSCLDGGPPTPGAGAAQSSRYIVYRLPAESSLIGTECVICLEEFIKGSLVARMSCLCSFHSPCLSAWLQRGRSCPVHAR